MNILNLNRLKLVLPEDNHEFNDHKFSCNICKKCNIRIFTYIQDGFNYYYEDDKCILSCEERLNNIIKEIIE